jgi:aryl-alcohol dehydrogenase-like predicted oxidoreductase
MEYRQLGRTDLRVSAVGYGCGSVGGLMIRGDRNEMTRAVARAIDAGINYFDTARLYGNGQSETNLGQVLRELSAEVVVGTKVKLEAPDMHDVAGAVVAHVEGSLQRLGRERVDVVSLHHPVGASREIDRQILDVHDVAAAAEAFSTLVGQGKIRYWGMNAVGDTAMVHKALAAAHPFAVQAVYNLLNPSGSIHVPAGFPFQDYQGVMHAAAEQGIGVFAIRVLAGGALTGTAARHPNASPPPTPMATSRTYTDDLERAQAFRFMLDDGYADSMAEASLRFVLSNPDISTALVGIASIEQLEQALAAAVKGPLPTEAHEKLQRTWASFAH